MAYEHRDDVQNLASKLSGSAEPGSTIYFSRWQTALSEVVSSIEAENPESIKQFKNTAEHWNQQGPPEELQRR